MNRSSKIKHTPKYIIFWAVSNYLSGSELEALIAEFTKGSHNRKVPFFPIIEKHFDFERFRTQPIFWQDIWIYNYINYEIIKEDGRTIFPRTALLKKYDKEIMTPTIEKVKEMKFLINPF